MPEPIDPSGFNIYAQLVVADSGATFDLWTGGADGTDRFNEGGDTYAMNPGQFYRGGEVFIDIPVLQSISIELNLGLNGKINIEIAAPFDLGLALLESQLFTIGNAVEVQVGYPKTNRFTPWFNGMSAKPSIRIDPDSGLTATLNIEGAGFAALRSSGTDPFTNQSYQDVIQAVADRNDWDIEPPDVGNFSADSPDPYLVTRASVSQGGATDFIFLRNVTRQAGLDFYLNPSPRRPGKTSVFLSRRDSVLGSAPRYTFVARGKSDFTDTFPLLSFESQAEGVWLPRGTGTVRSEDIDPFTRDCDPQEVSQATSSVTASGEGQVGDGGGVVGETHVRARRAADTQTLGEWHAASARDPMTPLERIRSHSTEQAMRGGINATITSFGIPDLVPTDVIAIDELGIFSGNYGIQGLTHNAAAGEWRMTMTLLSNAASLAAIAEQLQASPESFNTEAAPVSNDTTSTSTPAEPEPSDTGES